MKRKKTKKVVRKMIREKIEFEFKHNLERQLDRIMGQLEDSSFDAKDTVTINFPFKFEGFDFFKKQ